MSRKGLMAGADGQRRCWWPGEDPLYVRYHDREWGRPVATDHRLFEKICLEGFQSGLSWLTILRKRENFRRAFSDFHIEAVARFGPRQVQRLLRDEGIVRHRGKIESTINNAQRARELREEFGSLAAYLWSWEPPAERRPRAYDYETLMAMSKTEESSALSKDLRRRGFTFVGPTAVYALMQAAGLVNDHLDGCAVRPLVEAARARFKRPRASSEAGCAPLPNLPPRVRRRSRRTND